MTDSIDALITEGRKLTSAYGRYSAYGELVRNLADALESTAAELRQCREDADIICQDNDHKEAELRQERERAEQYRTAHDLLLQMHRNEMDAAEADLARAREVIEKVRAAFVAQTHKQMVRDINLAIVEYDTKEQS